MTTIRSWRTEAIILAFLLPVALVLGLVLMRWPQEATISSPSPIVPTPVVSQAVEQTPNISPTSSAIPTSSPQSQTINVEIKALGKQRIVKAPISGSVTVAELLLKAQKEKLIALETKEYGGTLGLFIEAIDGVKNDNATQTYWQLYINGKKSALGASAVDVTSEDQISWRYQQETKETR